MGQRFSGADRGSHQPSDWCLWVGSHLLVPLVVGNPGAGHLAHLPGPQRPSGRVGETQVLAVSESVDPGKCVCVL